MTYFFSHHLNARENQFAGIIQNFRNGGTLVGDGRRNVLKYFNINGSNINFKSFREPNILNKIVYRHFRKSKAKRSYENARYLLSKGLNTPEPIAYLEYYDMLGLDSSYYICRQLDNVTELRVVMADAHYPDRDKILQAYTAYFFKMHENGIRFLDNSPGNSLIGSKEDGYEIYLVDLNRMQFNRQFSIPERMKNFSRLSADKNVLEIIAHAYSALSDVPAGRLLNYLLFYTDEFRLQRLRKKSIKKKWNAFKKLIGFSAGIPASPPPFLPDFM